jgi:hypothetical protein
MTTDEIVLHEAERWFRSKLRGESNLYEFEQRLFSALADRQISRSEIYTPRERAPEKTSVTPPTADPLPTTKPPPADIQRELLRLSRVDIVGGPPLRPEKRK